MADGRVRVWRRKGERYADACVMERDSWGGQSIMVWGAIGISHKAGPIIFVNIGLGRGKCVTALRYTNQVIRLHIVPYFGRHQQHMFQQHNIKIKPWPALSPDLNPIEHLWDEIQRKLN